MTCTDCQNHKYEYAGEDDRSQDFCYCAMGENLHEGDPSNAETACPSFKMIGMPIPTRSRPAPSRTA